MNVSSQQLPGISEESPRSGAGELPGGGGVPDEMAAHDLAVKRNPKSANAHAGRAWALWRAGRSPEARQAALKALTEVPVHLPSLELLARLALQKGDITRARMFCESLQKLKAVPLAHTLLKECESTVLKPYLHGAFDAYVSLGSNCEAGMQLVRRGYHESSFFRYTLASYEQVRDLIANDFSDVFQREHLMPWEDGMVRDVRTGISFHSGLRSQCEPATGVREFSGDYDFSAIYQDERSKIAHFIEKWRRLTASPARVLYLMKFEDDNGRLRAQALRDLLVEKYPQHDFVLLFLQTIEQQEGDWGMARVVNRYLPRFAPLDAAHDADLSAWDTLMNAFPLKSSLGLPFVPKSS